MGPHDAALTPASSQSPFAVSEPSWFTDTVLCGSQPVSYTVHRSLRARSVRLTIQPGAGLIATVPFRQPLDELRRFLRRHEQWVLSQLKRLQRQAATVPRRWPYGETLPYRGEEHRVVLRTPAPASRVECCEDRTLLVHLRRATLVGAKRALTRWYRQEASREVLRQTTRLAEAFGISVRRVAVRDQRRRWGSCSATGYLNFNFRLIMTPPSVMEYVIIHELMHRRELNHSQRFWQLVAAHCPTYRDARAWLKRHGPYLNI